MGAAPTHLHQLERVQRRALHLMGPRAILQSLASRREEHAPKCLNKLMYWEEPLQLIAILPHRQDATLDPPTRSQHHQSHECQLCQELVPYAPNFLKRSFPWNHKHMEQSTPRRSSLRYQRPSYSRRMYFATRI